MTLPERLGRLRRVDRIGAGGFATVWLYHDDELDSPVAVKALADNWAQRSDVRERFLEEARMLRRCDSEHVVRVYDIGEVDQTPYFVMSYADGGSLATLTDGGPIPPERAVELVTQAADGIHVLHDRGIVHRDIKPQNLLLRTADDGSDEVLVADLGVAKAMLHASGLTQVVGTPAYMAPEQAAGLGVDGRADIHALGAVFYHLITGHYARDGGIADLANPSLPRPPSTFDPRLKPYDGAVLRALEPRPEDRWDSVRSFSSALQQAAGILAPDPEASVTLMEPPPPHRRKGRRLLWALSGSIAIALIAGVSVAMELQNRNPQHPPAKTPITGTPTARPATDVKYPKLAAVTLTVRHQVVAPDGSRWSYKVPKGWFATNTQTGRAIPAAKIDHQSDITWLPPNPPLVGGYSLTFRALTPTTTPQELRQQLMRKLPTLANVHRFTVLPDHPDNGLWFTYVDGLQHLRYDFFRWLSVPSGNAGLQVAVVGRTIDEPGLQALLDSVVASAFPRS